MWNAAKTLFTPTTANLTKHSETRSLKEFLKKSRFRTIFSQIKDVDFDLLIRRLSVSKQTYNSLQNFLKIESDFSWFLKICIDTFKGYSALLNQIYLNSKTATGTDRKFCEQFMVQVWKNCLRLKFNYMLF